MPWFLIATLPIHTLQDQLIQVSQKVGKAVVSISVTSRKVVATSPFTHDPFWNFFFPPDLVEREVHSLGSGILLSSEGEILTNAHVLGKQPDSIIVTLPSGHQYPATIIGIADIYDLALLKVDATGLPHVALGNSDSLQIGQIVLAIGNPFGFLLEDLEPTVTVGVISALHRTLKGEQQRKYYDMIQTDAAINPGNSGGPLVDLEGRVIGINTFIFSSSGGSEGVGFAIPINTAKKVVHELRRWGKIRPALLGFWVQELTSGLREALGYQSTGGVLIQDVLPGHPASRFLEDGDILLSLNGRHLFNVGDFHDAAYALFPGDRIVGKRWRRGHVQLFQFQLPPLQMPPVTNDNELGAKLRPVNREMAWYYNLPVDYGVRIESLSMRSILARLGLREGDVIVTVNDQKIRSPRDLKQAFANRQLVLRIVRGGQELLLRFWR